MCGIWAVFGSDADVSVHSSIFHKVSHRGPDAFRIESINHFQNCYLGFHRLAIVDDLAGMQPMRLYTHPHLWFLYNGEIYNHKLLQREYDLKCSTECDGEVVIHLFAMQRGIDFVAQQLDGVFAFCLLDTLNRKVYLGRDTYGVRPVFKLHTDSGLLAVCSEAKGLQGLLHADDYKIEPFSPGYVETFHLNMTGQATLLERSKFHKVGKAPMYNTLVTNLGDDVKVNIRTLLNEAVRKRLMSDRRIGCLLSGGLDSSLIAALFVKNIKETKVTYCPQTFSIGLEGSPDILAARKVAKYLDTDHHEIIFTPKEGIDALEKVIFHLESYDITTVRASVCLYLMSKYIKEKTEATVIMSGEGADELAQGYIYFHKAPSHIDADKESRRLLEDIYLFDGLRCDRVTASWSLEIRVPFLDHQLTSYYLSLHPKLRQPKKGVEKYLLRTAFTDSGLLPDDILWRPKEAFSDGVSCVKESWFAVLQNYIDKQVTRDELIQAGQRYPMNPPQTKEAYYYRKIFEKYYPTQEHLTHYFWMPKWITATDPSARTLKHYKN